MLGRFVIPIYYVLGERLGAIRRRSTVPAQSASAAGGDGRGPRPVESTFAEAVESQGDAP
jgi:hypothetical protein